MLNVVVVTNALYTNQIEFLSNILRCCTSLVRQDLSHITVKGTFKMKLEIIMDTKQLIKAAKLIESADSLLIGAGAGMGVDSGLPDFRGSQGFWRAYPLLEDRRLTFEDLANGDLFYDEPELAWWFYGHRFSLYKKTIPHNGFNILKRWCDSKLNKNFIFTSNVDGHFQKTGFSDDEIIECHGSINHLQCSNKCNDKIWALENLNFNIDKNSTSVNGTLPLCPNCGGVARPNILMFNDDYWISSRTNNKRENFNNWYDNILGKKTVAIELGAAIPSVRRQCNSFAPNLIRINPRDYFVPDGAISIALPGLEALTQIENIINSGS